MASTFLLGSVVVVAFTALLLAEAASRLIVSAVSALMRSCFCAMLTFFWSMLVSSLSCCTSNAFRFLSAISAPDTVPAEIPPKVPPPPICVGILRCLARSAWAFSISILTLSSFSCSRKTSFAAAATSPSIALAAALLYIASVSALVCCVRSLVSAFSTVKSLKYAGYCCINLLTAVCLCSMLSEVFCAAST